MAHHRGIHTTFLAFGLAIWLHSPGCDFGDENVLEGTGLGSSGGWSRTITGSFTRYDANLADMDGDRKDEVLIGIDNRVGQPSLGEPDGDGMLELVAVLKCRDHSVPGYFFQVHALDLPYEIPATTQWPMYQHDPRHSGLYSNQ